MSFKEFEANIKKPNKKQEFTRFILLALLILGISALLLSKAYPGEFDDWQLGNTYTETLTVQVKNNDYAVEDLTNITVKMLFFANSTDVRPAVEFTYDNDHAQADKTNGVTVLTINPYDYSFPFTEAWFHDDDDADYKLAYFGNTTSDYEYLNDSTTNYTFLWDTSDYLYLGRSYKFRWVKTSLSTKGVAGTLLWEYWNGSTWASLTVTDWDYGASNMRYSGSFYFTVPSDWAKKVLSSEIIGEYWMSCYWIRAHEDINFTTNPIESTIKTGGIEATTYQVRRIRYSTTDETDVVVKGWGSTWTFKNFGWN